jgi:hypothetical protein
VYCNRFTFRSFRSGDGRGLFRSEAGGVYVNVSSLSFRQPLAAEFARDVNDGISTRLTCCLYVVSGW